MLLKKDLKNKKNQLLVNAQVSVEFLDRKTERAFKKQNLDYIRYRKVTEELTWLSTKKCNTGKYTAGSKIKIKILIKVI